MKIFTKKLIKKIYLLKWYYLDLKYEDTVNMQDTTGLDRVEFTDKFDLGQPKSSSYNPPKGKEVNFLDKFGDSEPIGESGGWDTCENEFTVPEKKIFTRT